jgi:uncharacterized protein with HEPN domain
MTGKDPRSRLLDIVETIEALRDAIGSMTYQDFRASWSTRRAAERAIEIISEASRHIPDELKAKAPSVPWREVAAIGNVLRHAYHRVDEEVIYTIVTRQIGEIERAVRLFLAEYAAESSARRNGGDAPKGGEEISERQQCG